MVGGDRITDKVLDKVLYHRLGTPKWNRKKKRPSSFLDCPRVLSPLTSSTFVVPSLVSFHGELLRWHCYGPF